MISKRSKEMWWFFKFSTKEWMNRLMEGGFANKSTKIGVFTSNKWSKSIMTCRSYKIDDVLVSSVNNGYQSFLLRWFCFLSFSQAEKKKDHIYYCFCVINFSLINIIWIEKHAVYRLPVSWNFYQKCYWAICFITKV